MRCSTGLGAMISRTDVVAEGVALRGLRMIQQE